MPNLDWTQIGDAVGAFECTPKAWMRKLVLRTCVAALIATGMLPLVATGTDVEAIESWEEPLGPQLAHLASLVKDARIVLLGENGHGVAEFTKAKVALTKWLHDENGFDLVVFESGLYECDSAWRRVREISPSGALRDCLSYPFEHAEALPLFEYIRASAGTDSPLAFSGMDFQSQGYDSENRPRENFERLVSHDSSLAHRIARADTALYLMEKHGGHGDAVYEFAYENADSLKAEYRRAANRTEGADRLIFTQAEGWIDRLAIRGAADADSLDERPGRYYELRDEWMARAVQSLADSLPEKQRVIVWLHNDHARYGRFWSRSDSIRSTGGYLREWYGDDVVSVGFFLGHGEIATNSRQPREVAPMPADGVESFLSQGGAMSYLVLRGNDDAHVMEWAEREHPYLRMGLETLTLTPAHEFDALLYVDSVSVPTYGVRRD